MTIGLGLAAVLLAYFLSGLASLLVATTLCVLIWLLRPLLMPPEDGATKVRVLSVTSLFALTASHGFWAQVVNGAAKTLAANPLLRDVAPWIQKVDLGNGPSIVVLVFVAVGLWIVNYYMADKSIGGGHPVPIKADFPEESFQKKLDSFCSAMRQHLMTTDREANWSPDYYADLEAEVEVVTMAGVLEKKRIVDLQGAMRSDRTTQAFLVLGDPGAGKSVALRKLARDMLDEVGKTGRVPIYVNLREWLPKVGRRNAAWTEQSKPTMQELEHFVVDNIKARGDVFTEDFVAKYFRDLWRHGRLFFIFDSFDEIPELLDVNEESWLINALSELLSRFISSNPQSRGVLASRIFRRPTQTFLAQKILEIRPLSEERIIQALARFPAFTPDLQITLFRDRLDLIPIARNPFLMALLGEWVNDYRTLPQTQAQLYDNYLKGRLARCAARIAQYGLTDNDILRGATQIAWFVFESPAYGLEAPVRVIDEAGATQAAVAIIDVLSYARIARVTQGEPKSFAFVHRRFLEYLVTTRLLDQPEDLPVEHIPTDSRGRDALVLFAQLCDIISAEKLAVLCWSEIQTHFYDPSTRLRAIHCLRFLIDAYRSRRAAIEPFASKLAEFINLHVAKGDDLVHAKICLEGTGLLSETDALPILQTAMAGKNSWLQETAFRACRHLPRLEPELEQSIKNYVIAMSLSQFWTSRRALTFSLSLSESLSGVHRTAELRYRNLLMSAVAAPLAFVAMPVLGVWILIIYLGVYAEYWTLSSVLEFHSSFLRGRVARSFAEPLAIWQRLSRLIMLRGGQDVSVQFLRITWGAALIACGAGILAAPKWFPAASPILRQALFWDWYQGRYWTPGLAMILLGMMILDWLILQVLCQGLLRALKKRRKAYIFGIGAGALVAGLFVYGLGAFFDWLVKLLKQWGLEWILIAPAVLGAGLAAAAISWKAGRVVYYHVRDMRMLKLIAVTSRMQRRDIVAALDSLRTNRYRLTFVRYLAQKKTLATGEWPAGFRLSLEADPVLTELAKLEERWLRLDR